MKSIQKSIRMTPEIYEYIESFKGNNFNDKFANCLLFCMDANADLLTRRAGLKRELEELSNKIDDLRGIVSSLQIIETYVNFACDHVLQK